MSAPVEWQQDEKLRRFFFRTGESVSCVFWDGVFYITGTDILRCVSFRLQAFGRLVKNSKKFEEGIFSNLRKLKPATGASLETSGSPFLEFLLENRCIRTMKKQKVFFWYSVPHDRLFVDALERDIRKEKSGQAATTVAVAEPALSFQHDPSRTLYEQLVSVSPARLSSNAWELSSTQQELVALQENATETMPIHDTMVGIRTGSMSSFDELDIDLLDFPAVCGESPFDGFYCHKDDRRLHSLPDPTKISFAGFDYAPAPYPTPPSPHQSHYGASPRQHISGVYTRMSEIVDSATPNQFTGTIAITQAQSWNADAPQFSNSYTQNNLCWLMQGSSAYQRCKRRPYGSSRSTCVSGSTASTHDAQHGPISLKGSVSEASSTSSEPGTTEITAHQAHPCITSIKRTDGAQQPPDASLTPAQDSSVPAEPSFHRSPLEENSASGFIDQNSMASSLVGVAERGHLVSAMEDNDRPFLCRIPSCGRMFKRLQHLQRHKRIHTQEKPYICFYCNKAFSRSDNLVQHVRRHGSEKKGKHSTMFSTEEEEEEQEHQDDDDSASLDGSVLLK